MKRLIAIAIAIAVFAAMILPSGLVMAWETFHQSFSILGAQGEVWGSYNKYNGYYSVSMRVQPTNYFYAVVAHVHVNLDGDNSLDTGEPYISKWNDYGHSSNWDDPVTLSLGGIIPEWARNTFDVRYFAQTWSWVRPAGFYPVDGWLGIWNPA